MPLINSVLATYDRPNWLKEVLKSTLNQEFDNYEIIVVDDGSAEDLTPIVNELEDNRIRLIEHDKNRGLGAARNTGVEAAEGELISFQDDDDLWVEHRMARQVEYLDNLEERVDVLVTGSLVLPDNLAMPRSVFLAPEESRTDLLKLTNIVWPDHGMVRKEVFESGVRFDESRPAREDTELWLRLSEDVNFHWLEEPLSFYYLHEDNMTGETEQRIRGTRRLYSKHEKIIKDKFLEFFNRRLKLIGDRLNNRSLFIGGSGEAGQKSVKCLQEAGVEVDAFLNTLQHFDPNREEAELPVYGLNELMKKDLKPYILIESLYGDQIAGILDKAGLKHKEDYMINCISPLLDNIPEDELNKVL